MPQVTQTNLFQKAFYTFLCSSFYTFCQVDQSAFVFKEHSKAKFGFKYSNINYFKNDEYFNQIADGQTHIGQWIDLRATFRPLDSLCISGGLWLHRPYGKNAQIDIKPALSVSYTLPNSRIVAGNLSGNAAHELIEPLYDFKNILVNPQETGLQYLIKKNTFAGDVWVDWQYATKPGATNQEQIWGGFSTKYTWKQITLIGQFSAFHKGGQNLALPFAVSNHFVLASGFVFKRDRLSFQPMALVGKNQNQNMSAWYLNSRYTVRSMSLNLVLFKPNAYQMPLANDLFSTYSSKLGLENQPKNQFTALLSAQYTKALGKAANIHLRLEPVYAASHLDYSFGIYFNTFY